MRQRAEQLRRAQRFGEALSTYRTLARQDPANFEDRFWVAKLESWTGSLEAAESAFVKLVAERPDDYDTRIALADLHLRRGQTSAARSVLDGLRRSYPDDPEVLIRLGRVSQAAGNPQEARRSNLLRVIAAFGAESFTQPSRDLIGEFQAHAIGAAWRQFLTPRVGFEVAYAHLIRSADTQRDSYSLRVVQRW